MRNRENLYDFQAIGQAIKDARNDQGMTREQLSEIIGIAARNLAQIESKGQHPRFQCFYELVTMFNISVDEYFYPDIAPVKSTRRRQLDALIDELDEKDYIVLEGTARALQEAQYDLV